MISICTRCGGTGEHYSTRSHVPVGKCFECQGTGNNLLSRPEGKRVREGVKTEQLLCALLAAEQKGVKRPKLRAGRFTFVLAPALRYKPDKRIIYVRGGMFGGNVGMLGSGTFLPVRGIKNDEVIELIDLLSGELSKQLIKYAESKNKCACCDEPVSHAEAAMFGAHYVCAEEYEL